jgi:hypothetical protein
MGLQPAAVSLGNCCFPANELKQTCTLALEKHGLCYEEKRNFYITASNEDLCKS